MKKTLNVLLILALISCNKKEVTNPADAIYFGGDIVTMEGKEAVYAEAIAVKDGKILFVGGKTEAEKFHGDKTEMKDLEGKTLLPGFVDGHSHFSEVGLQAITANLLCPPDGTVKNITELQELMREFIKKSPMVKKYHIAIGMNYDNSQLAEGRHPNRQDLDAISTEIPVFITHQSGHFGVLNTKGLEVAGITVVSKNPAGGVIQRESDGKTPNGVFEEVAFFQVIVKMMPKFSPEEATDMLKKSEDIYLTNGFTTIHDGKTSEINLKLLPVLADKGFFRADIVSYPDLVALGDTPVLHGSLMSKEYKNHFRIGGVKLTLDGSPQGKTGYFTKPYFVVPKGEKPSYRGYPAFIDEKLDVWVDLAYKNNWQLFAHCSGDAANDQLINAVRNNALKYLGKDRRTVMMHAHFLRPDQVKNIKELEIFPSVFPLHTFNWGDYHRQSVVGPERAENIAPTGWLLDNNIHFSIHSDAPVIFPRSMPLIATAVNRTTRSGYVLGPKQRINPYVALKAMTIWSAEQIFDEKTKGSLVKGKLADFVILDKNPIKVDSKTINDIQIMETVKEGKSVYKKED